MSLLTVERITTGTLKLSEDKMRSLYRIAEKCLGIVYGSYNQLNPFETEEKLKEESCQKEGKQELDLSSEEILLLGELMKDIEKSEILNT